MAMAASFSLLVSLSFAALSVTPAIFVVASHGSERLETRGGVSTTRPVGFREDIHFASVRRDRNLLQQQRRGQEAGGGEGREMAVDPDRMGDGECSKDYIVVYQAPTAPLVNGIPTYTVQVLNTCLGQGCGGAGGGIAAVHLRCGWFSSARLVNPKVFRRLGFDDCLVNDGRPIPAGGAVSFQYANTYPYRLSVSSVSCTPPKFP